MHYLLDAGNVQRYAYTGEAVVARGVQVFSHQRASIASVGTVYFVQQVLGWMGSECLLLVTCHLHLFIYTP